MTKQKNAKTSVNLTVLGFNIFSFIIDKVPATIGDVPGEFQKTHTFKEDGEAGTPARTFIAVGLLGKQWVLKK
ncbi:MAG: hypothetical protein AAB705_00685 [Patescibacteria group bacterium]